jgi:GNAT superfamily N-acetyltransferase
VAVTSSEALTVRPIRETDAAAAAALSGELGYPADPAVMRERIARIGSLSDHAIFVACLGDLVVGWIHVATVLHVQAAPRAEIGGLVVTAECRSAGIGTALVRRAESWARSNGLETMVVRSQAMREAAHRFYLREGYVRTKTSAVFSKPLAP